MKVSVRIGRDEDFSSEAKDWDCLFRDAQNATPFQHRQWNRNWVNRFGKHKTLLLFELYCGRDLIGLWPIYRTFGFVAALKPIGFPHADYTHPLFAPGFPTAFDELLEAVRDYAYKTQTTVDISHLRQDFLGNSGAKPTIESQPICAVLDLPKSTEDYLQSIGKSLRTDLRRGFRKFLPENNFQLDWARPESVQTSMEELIQLHNQRWHRRFRPGSFIGKTRQFHSEWAQSAAQEKMLRLAILRHDHQPIAAFYGFSVHEKTYFYQSGFDENWKSSSPGSFLIASAIARSIEEGCVQFDFLRGIEPYKLRWRPQQVHPLVSILECPQTGRGIPNHYFEMRNSVEARLRERFE